MTKGKRFKFYVTFRSWAIPLHIDWFIEDELLVSLQFLCFNYLHGPAECLYEDPLYCPCGKDPDDCPIHADAQG